MKESRSLRTAFRSLRLSKQGRSKGKDDGHRRDDQVLSPVAPATSFKSAAQSSTTDEGIFQATMADPLSMSVASQSQNAASSPIFLAPLVQKLPTAPSAEFPPPATMRASSNPLIHKLHPYRDRLWAVKTRANMHASKYAWITPRSEVAASQILVQLTPV